MEVRRPVPGYWSNPVKGLCWFGLSGSITGAKKRSNSGYVIDFVIYSSYAL